MIFFINSFWIWLDGNFFKKNDLFHFDLDFISFHFVSRPSSGKMLVYNRIVDWDLEASHYLLELLEVDVYIAVNVDAVDHPLVVTEGSLLIELSEHDTKMSSFLSRSYRSKALHSSSESYICLRRYNGSRWPEGVHRLPLYWRRQRRFQVSL